jgi:hypothetical protein
MNNEHFFCFKAGCLWIALSVSLFLLLLAAACFWGVHLSKEDSGGASCGGTCAVSLEPASVDTVYVPKPADTVYVPVPQTVDTAKIISDYYLQKIYRDTLHLAVSTAAGRDSVRAIVTDTIWQNGIAGRRVSFTFYPKRLVRDHSVGVLSTFGYRNLAVMAEYRYRMMKMYAGYNFIDHAPVAGVGFQLFNW